MIVYRLEDKDGWGPFSYRTDWPDEYDGDASIHSNQGCTVPYVRDGNMDERAKYRFGCRNMTQLKKYWGDQLQLWQDSGWIVAKYKVRRNYVEFGNMDIELAFKIEKAERLA